MLGPEGGDVVKVHQDAGAYLARLNPGVSVEHEVADGQGRLSLCDRRFRHRQRRAGGHRDAAVITGPEEVKVTADDVTELILVDVPLDFHPVTRCVRPPHNRTEMPCPP